MTASGHRPALRRALLAAAALAALLLLAAAARQPLSAALHQRGRQHREAWRLDDAVSALGLSCRLGKGAFDACLELAACHQLQGNFLAAEEVLRRLDVPAASLLEARLLDALGVARFHFNRPDEALELHTRSAELGRRHGDRRLEAAALIHRARVLYHAKGRLQESLDLLARARRLGEELGDDKIAADALRHQGAVHWWLERQRDRALRDHYRPALALYRRSGDLHGEAITLSNIGLVHQQRGDLFQFLRYQTESLELKERLGDTAGQSDSYLYLGGMYRDLGNLAKAYEQLMRSRDLGRSGGYELGRNEAEAALAKVCLELGRDDQAIALLEALHRRQTAAPWLARYRLLTLGGLYMRRGETHAAERLLERAVELDRASDARELAAVAPMFRADLHLARGDWRAALELLRSVPTMPREPIWIRLEGHRMMARAEELRGRPKEALGHLLAAAEAETAVYATTGSPLVLGQRGDVYERLFTFLFPPSGKDRPSGLSPDETAVAAFEGLERLRYRALRNLVVRLDASTPDPLEVVEPPPPEAGREGDPAAARRLYREYEDRLLAARLSRDHGQRLRRRQPATVAEVQRRLAPATALVAFLQAGEEIVALAVRRSSLSAHRLGIGTRALADKVRLLRFALFRSDRDDDWPPIAADLRSRLIEPLEKAGALDGADRLGLILSGPLHDLPFAALARPEGDRARFLVEDYTLFVAPAATLIALDDRGPRASSGLRTFGRNDRRSAEPLRFAEAEAKRVAGLAGGAAWIGDAATETALKGLAPRARRLHLATHAVSEPLMPLLSHLRLAATAEDDGRLTVGEVLDLRLDADLVTLSACRSGQSYSTTGNHLTESDRLGLAEAFLYAGADSVLASLLPVDDRSTLALMTAFYRHLESTDPAAALAASQRAMIVQGSGPTAGASGDPSSHPRSWAPFMVIGRGR